jgi:cell division protein ZapA
VTKATKSTTSIEVEILGATYNVRSEHTPDYLEQLAGIVDQRMREISQRVATVDSGRIAVLAALNLADELLRCTRQQEGEQVQISEKLAELTGELSAALDV